MLFGKQAVCDLAGVGRTGLLGGQEIDRHNDAHQQVAEKAHHIVLTLNYPRSNLIKGIIESGNTACADELKPVVSEMKGLQARIAALHQSQSGKKPEEISQEEKDDLKNTEKSRG